MNSKSQLLITFFPLPQSLSSTFFSCTHYIIRFPIKVQLSIYQSENISNSSLPLLFPVSRRMYHCIYTDPSLLPVQTLLVLHILPSTTLTFFPLFFPHNRNSVSLDCSVRDYKKAAVLSCFWTILPWRRAQLFPEHTLMGNRAEQKPILSQLLSFVITTLPLEKGQTTVAKRQEDTSARLALELLL